MPKLYLLNKIFPILALAGTVLSVLGAFVNPTQFAYSWFFSFYFFFTIALGSFFWVTLHYACNSGWTVVVRRVWETVIALFPLFFVLFIPISMIPELRQVLWQWFQPIHAHDPELIKKAGYLNAPFFYIRLVLYFGYFWLAGRYYWKKLRAPGFGWRPAPHTRHVRFQLHGARPLRRAGNVPELRAGLWGWTGAGTRACLASTTSRSAPRPAWRRASFWWRSCARLVT